MSLWDDKYEVTVHLWNGVVEGAKYYFPSKEEAETFRLSIVKEKDVQAVYVRENPDFIEDSERE